MELNQFFKSIIDQDNCAIVVCDLEHTMIYMNPKAVENYANRGGSALIGKSLMDCHNPHSVQAIERVVEWFAKSPDNNRIHTFYNEKQNKDGYMIALRDDDGKLIGYYEKHEYRDKDETPFYAF